MLTTAKAVAGDFGGLLVGSFWLLVGSQLLPVRCWPQGDSVECGEVEHCFFAEWVSAKGYLLFGGRSPWTHGCIGWGRRISFSRFIILFGSGGRETRGEAASTKAEGLIARGI